MSLSKRKTFHEKMYHDHLNKCRVRVHRICEKAYFRELCIDVRKTKLHKIEVFKMRVKCGHSYCYTTIQMAKIG